MITERDKKIINHVKEKGEADFMELYNEFFGGKSEDLPKTTQEFARRTINGRLVERGHLKRRKGPDDRFSVYYL